MNLMKAYFFVPSDRADFLVKARELNYDELIIDFEDSIQLSDVKVSLKNLDQYGRHDEDWIRISTQNDFEPYLDQIISMGYTRFVLPKIANLIHLERLLNETLEKVKNLRLIILVENPEIYLSLKSILSKWSTSINGIAFGSHDFCSLLDLKHDLKLLESVRLELRILAGMFNKEVIDVASMNISEKDSFQDEIRSGFDLGFRSKFIIHPFQLDILNQFPFYNEIEVADSIEILGHLKDGKQQNAVITHRGKIYEKPHINRLLEIKNWGKSYYGIDRKIL